jgi:hypothetical protein
MPTFAKVREQIRQRLEAEHGEPCPTRILNCMCILIAIVARGETDRFLNTLPSDAKREDLHEGLGLIQEEWPEAIRLVRAEGDRLLAEASRQGLDDRAAEKRVTRALRCDFFQYNYREIREQVRSKMSAVKDPPIPISEERLRTICMVLTHLLFDPSGRTLRLQSPDPRLWDDEGDARLASMRQRFADELELLNAETKRLVEAAYARGMRDDAMRRLIETRLNREFIGKCRRRRPSG